MDPVHALKLNQFVLGDSWCSLIQPIPVSTKPAAGHAVQTSWAGLCRSGDPWIDPFVQSCGTIDNHPGWKYPIMTIDLGGR